MTSFLTTLKQHVHGLLPGGTKTHHEKFTTTHSTAYYLEEALALFLALVLLLLIMASLGKYLWNEVLVCLFPMVKKVTSGWQILGFSLLLRLLL